MVDTKMVAAIHFIFIKVSGLFLSFWTSSFLKLRHLINIYYSHLSHQKGKSQDKKAFYLFNAIIPASKIVFITLKRLNKYQN